MSYHYKLTYFGHERVFAKDYTEEGWEPVPNTVPVVKKDGTVYLWIRRERNYNLVAR